MKLPLGIRTDYNLLGSLITIDHLITYLKDKNITACGILDDYLFSSIPFIRACEKNNIKPIIGFNITIDNSPVYLYAQNYNGLQNLFKLNTIKQDRSLSVHDLYKYHHDIILVLPFISRNLIKELSFFSNYYYSYELDSERDLINEENKLFIKKITCFSKDDVIYLDMLDKIKTDVTNHSNEYFMVHDLVIYEEFIQLIDLKLPINKRYIPIYNKDYDSAIYLKKLSMKGLEKRLKNNVDDIYLNRLTSELKVINEMNFNDYFLIVYDYVLYAKKNGILVGPGRGSGAASLVCYALGITDVDPIKYDLLFERFLNQERVTLPDIDIDFLDTRRDEVVNYIKLKYKSFYAGNIITYSTLKTKVVLRLVAEQLNIESELLNQLLKNIDGDKTILENENNPVIKKMLTNESIYNTLFNYAKKLEGLKHHTSVHAAGVVISSIKMDNIIPLYKDHEEYITGVTMEYLEDLGLIKMDILALKNLGIINEIIKKYHITLNDISLEDKETLEAFSNADTLGVFQFEGNGMINFLKKLKIDSFNNIYDALALFRPGPINNIETYISNKNKAEINYLVPALEPILKSTYGVIVYQEQIMEIMVKLGNFTLSEADITRRAMAKKKMELLTSQKEKFINGCISNHISNKLAQDLFDLITKFASYGFNKAHSVSYALISYYQMYLKVHYNIPYYTYLLNGAINNIELSKKYIAEVKSKKIIINYPDINKSMNTYIGEDTLYLPFNIIKNVSSRVITEIINKRNTKYTDIFDFVSRMDNIINKETLIELIKANCFNHLHDNKKVLIDNIDIILNYGKLAANLGTKMIEKPLLAGDSTYTEEELIKIELDTFGFLIRHHQVSKYTSKELTKVGDVTKYFLKNIKNVMVIEQIKKIKTKNNEDMLIIDASDESGHITLVAFSEVATKNEDLKNGDIIEIKGIVKKRFNEYQISVNEIKKIVNL